MLTKTAIDRATPAPTPFVLWDDELGGFGCKIHPTGRRSFVVQYRRPGSRRLYQITLGAYGVLTVTEARSEARKLLANVRLGSDPFAGRRAALPAAITVIQLVEKYSAALKAGTASSKRLRGRTASTGYLEDTLLQLTRFAAAYGPLAADSIVRTDVRSLLDHYVARPAVHRRMHGAIRRMYAWAQACELVNNAPADHIETTSPASRERVLTPDELARIWQAAETLEEVYTDTIKLMIATGQRRGEVAGMQWGEIDLARALWTLPAVRTKARRQHVLPLPDLAVAVLHRRRASFRNVPAPDDLVLPTLARDGRSVAPVSGWNWLKRELDRACGVTSWRLHDFRRSLVTICAEQGADVAVLDSMLNHASSATRGGIIGIYQRATLIEPTRKVMTLWDDLLREAIRSCQTRAD
jgi:integrase